MTVAEDTITLVLRGAVAWVTIARADAGNALRSVDVERLGAILRSCEQDDRVRVVVLRGSGGRFFCSGGDIRELAGGVPDIGVHIGKWHTLLDAIEAGTKPVIAAINGIAVGGGLELALACHQRIAVEKARVGLPEVKVGMFPAASGIRRLTRIAGAAVATRIVLSAAMIDAPEALRLGIVDQLCAIDALDETAANIAAQYASIEPNAVRATLALAHASVHGRDTNEQETALFRACYENPRNREVLRAFMETQLSKRRPP